MENLILSCNEVLHVLPWPKKFETAENHDVERTLFDVLDHKGKEKNRVQ